MTIDWFSTIAGIVHTTPKEDAEVARVAAKYFHGGYFVTNKKATRLSHLVLSADFTDGDTEVTLCGIEVEGADLFPVYNWCPDCLNSADPESSGLGSES